MNRAESVAPPTGVMCECPLPVGLLDLVIRGCLDDTEYLVVVLPLTLLQFQFSFLD